MKAKTIPFSWITDFEIDRATLVPLMRAGRARWRVENEVFNTLKNQGFDLSHSFGHGHRNLCSVLAILMMLAFLIDQVQERCCRVFQAAKAEAVSRTTLWRRMRSFLFVAHLTGWEELMLRLAGEHTARPPPVGA